MDVMMRGSLVLAALLACSSKSEPRVGGGNGSEQRTATVATGLERALPATVPAGPYVVRYHCFHSDQPSGSGSQTVERTVDLGALTLTSVDNIVNDDRQPRPPTPPLVTKLDAAVAGKLRAAVERVVRGGPYRAELPEPEGTACGLAIGTSPTAAFFEIEKSSVNERDAVSDLIELIFEVSRGG